MFEDFDFITTVALYGGFPGLTCIIFPGRRTAGFEKRDVVISIQSSFVLGRKNNVETRSVFILESFPQANEYSLCNVAFKRASGSRKRMKETRNIIMTWFKVVCLCFQKKVG